MIMQAAELISSLAQNIHAYIRTKEEPLRIEKIRLKEILDMVEEGFSRNLRVAA